MWHVYFMFTFCVIEIVFWFWCAIYTLIVCKEYLACLFLFCAETTISREQYFKSEKCLKKKRGTRDKTINFWEEISWKGCGRRSLFEEKENVCVFVLRLLLLLVEELGRGLWTLHAKLTELILQIGCPYYH